MGRCESELNAPCAPTIPSARAVRAEARINLRSKPALKVQLTNGSGGDGVCLFDVSSSAGPMRNILKSRGKILNDSFNSRQLVLPNSIVYDGYIDR